MDLTATLAAPCAPERLFPLVEDLTSYPQWLEIVPRAEVDASTDELAWLVDLRGRLGPFARSKRLRMVRTRHEPPRAVRFERRENDSRRHAEWALDASVEPAGEGCVLTVHLHYGGALWLPVLDRMLRDEIERSRTRLLARVAA